MTYITKTRDEEFFMYPFKMEFKNTEFAHFCDHDGITHEYNCEIDTQDILDFLNFGLGLEYNFYPKGHEKELNHNIHRMSCRVENQDWQGEKIRTTVYLKHIEHMRWLFEEYNSSILFMNLNTWDPKLIDDAEIKAFFVERKLMGEEIMFDKTFLGA